MINKLRSNTRSDHADNFRRLRAACGRCCRGALRRLAAVKAKLEGEFSREMAGYEQLLKTALNEAEALAWQTSYPHLFFPVLAEEKAAEAQQWAGRQLAIRERTNPGHSQLQLAA